MKEEAKTFDVRTFDIAKFDEILARGLSNGVGERDGQMCIEAAICTVLELPHGDDPLCVAESVRQFKITLNDCSWSSAQARADGLRDLGLAQLGSKGVVNDVEFATRLAEKTIRFLLPDVMNLIDDPACKAAGERCKTEGTSDAASAARDAARAASAASAARYAARAASAASYAASDAARAASAASDAASAASYAASAARYAASDGDAFLKQIAKLALEVLIELKSPGCELLDRKEVA